MDMIVMKEAYTHRSLEIKGKPHHARPCRTWEAPQAEGKRAKRGPEALLGFLQEGIARQGRYTKKT